MKVLFINPQQEMAGLQCLSAYLKRAGHATALFNDPRLFMNLFLQSERLDRLFHVREEGFAAIEAFSPDLIGFSVVSDDYEWACAWAAAIRERCDIPIVFGNCHPTFYPRQVLAQPEVDFAARGEGEETLLELVEALGKGEDFAKIRGLAYKDHGSVRVNPMRPLIADLDSLPFPDKDLHYGPMPYLNHGYSTMTGRGCPFRCTFCHNNSSVKLYAEHGLAKSWVRRQSPRRVIAELLWAKERYGYDHIRFNDEEFAYDRGWLREFCALLKAEVGVPYFAWVSPNTIDAESAGLMGKSGCDFVEMGLQSGSERLRTDILHRRVSNERMAEAMRSLREAGIRPEVDLLLGLPTEMKADLDDTVELLRRGRPGATYPFWLRYYPVTDIFALAKERGLLSSEQIACAERDFSPRGSGYYREGNLRRESLARHYHTFILLMPLLPDWLIRLCQRWDLVRFTPAFFDSMVLAQVRRLFRGGMFDDYHLRIYHGSVWEFARLVRAWLSR
ncbi:MAG: hypothetical protein A2X36_07150 [Elusimicrobia bacterium GWA2_69_24]|nr:MAG: hypothetical protein A2X36_07150 [Elusimicrobia bacterium GWA2_69_24]